jgi:hypothetical protein
MQLETIKQLINSFYSMFPLSQLFSDKEKFSLPIQTCLTPLKYEPLLWNRWTFYLWVIFKDSCDFIALSIVEIVL